MTGCGACRSERGLLFIVDPAVNSALTVMVTGYQHASGRESGVGSSPLRAQLRAFCYPFVAG
jgi:hypothetical protein